MKPPDQLVILAVDQGAKSGYAIIRAGARVPSAEGMATTAPMRAMAMRQAVEIAGTPKLVYLVTEDHSKMSLFRGTKHDRDSRVGKRSGKVQRGTAQILGMGDARGAWREQARMVAVPETHFRQVTPSDWRRRVLGPSWARADTDRVREHSVTWATALLGRPVTHDTAAAVAMACDQALALPAQLERERADGRAKRAQRKGAL